MQNSFFICVGAALHYFNIDLAGNISQNYFLLNESYIASYLHCFLSKNKATRRLLVIKAALQQHFVCAINRILSCAQLIFVSVCFGVWWPYR